MDEVTHQPDPRAELRHIRMLYEVIANSVQRYVERKHSANLPILLRSSCLTKYFFRHHFLFKTMLQQQTNRSLSLNSQPHLVLLSLFQLSNLSYDQASDRRREPPVWSLFFEIPAKSMSISAKNNRLLNRDSI